MNRRQSYRHGDAESIKS